MHVWYALIWLSVCAVWSRYRVVTGDNLCRSRPWHPSNTIRRAHVTVCVDCEFGIQAIWLESDVRTRSYQMARHVGCSAIFVKELMIIITYRLCCTNYIQLQTLLQYNPSAPEMWHGAVNDPTYCGNIQKPVPYSQLRDRCNGRTKTPILSSITVSGCTAWLAAEAIAGIMDIKLRSLVYTCKPYRTQITAI